MGILSSQQGFQQGDSLEPFIFALVLQILVSAIGDDKDGSELGLQCWYIDDGVLAGHSKSPYHHSTARSLPWLEYKP